MGPALRSGFRSQLVVVDHGVRLLFDAVSDAVDTATSGLLGTPIPPATHPHSDPASILEQIERDVEISLACQAPVAGDLRFLLTVLRIAPELKRSVELAVHVQRRVPLLGELPPPVREEFEGMARTLAPMWRAVGTAWAAGDPDAAARLDEADDDIDVRAAEATLLLGQGEMPCTAAVEGRLVVRFLERLGDHSVHIGERIRWWATGADPVTQPH